MTFPTNVQRHPRDALGLISDLRTVQLGPELAPQVGWVSNCKANSNPISNPNFNPFPNTNPCPFPSSIPNPNPNSNPNPNPTSNCNPNPNLIQNSNPNPNPNLNPFDAQMK